MAAWHTSPFDTCIPSLGWSAGCFQPGPSLGGPGLGDLALCCAVVDMETLQLSICRVPGSGSAHSHLVVGRGRCWGLGA